MSFEKNVFINCPFDKEYRTFLNPLLFTIIYCGLEPLIAQNADSGNIRILHIIDLIKSSKYSIHDLSRMKASTAGELARFNMPFELGLEIGSRYFADGAKQLRNKKCLIVDEDKFRYQQVLSDLAGSDIQYYGNSRQRLVRAVRNWFAMVLPTRVNSGSFIWEEFNEFTFDFIENTTSEGYRNQDREEMPIYEYILFVKEWIYNRS